MKSKILAFLLLPMVVQAQITIGRPSSDVRVGDDCPVRPKQQWVDYWLSRVGGVPYDLSSFDSDPFFTGATKLSLMVEDFLRYNYAAGGGSPTINLDTCSLPTSELDIILGDVNGASQDNVWLGGVLDISGAGNALPTPASLPIPAFAAVSIPLLAEGDSIRGGYGEIGVFQFVFDSGRDLEYSEAQSSGDGVTIVICTQDEPSSEEIAARIVELDAGGDLAHWEVSEADPSTIFVTYSSISEPPLYTTAASGAIDVYAEGAPFVENANIQDLRNSGWEVLRNLYPFE